MAILESAGCYFQTTVTNGHTLTTAAAGPIVTTDTSDRAPTVDPASGFACSNTPFGRGHIIGLFLGGPDITTNYTPQWEQWQQSGAWKAMENTLASPAHAGRWMAVKITYARTGNVYD